MTLITDSFVSEAVSILLICFVAITILWEFRLILIMRIKREQENKHTNH